jgi:hypothetical protein
MSGKPTLYQPFEPPESACYPVSLLEGAIYYQVPSEKPADRACPRGEWYCQNPECVVREVTIFSKLHGEGRSVMRCPVCGSLLKFHHWLRTETLVPYKDETA